MKENGLEFYLQWIPELLLQGSTWGIREYNFHDLIAYNEQGRYKWLAMMIDVNEKIVIREHELKFTTSRSSGPGGQNVNKVNTRVTLWFDVLNSTSLSDSQKQLVLNRLASRINKEGVLQIDSQQHRSQLANRNAVIENFKELLCKALKRKNPRKKTGIPRAAKEARIREKKLRSRLKRKRAALREADN